MPKDYGELNFDKIFDKLDKMADKITKSGENVEGVAEKAGEQIGESFVGGIEQGLEDAASRIAASSLKINKAFKDLAKKITNQNISLGGINIDFSDINIDSDEFQKKIDKVFEQFKIDNAIEFDLKAAEKQFKNMLSLHTKYAIKLSKLQEQRPKLTSQASIKANAQEQLAVIDGLKEIQKILNQTSGMSIELPHVYFGDVKELRTSINLIEQLEKGEEKIGKQRDTNAEKIRKENKELKERNRILEEKVGPLEESPALKSKRSRVKSNMAKNAIPDYSMLPKEGKMILYHNTSSKNVGSIIKNGLRADAGKEQGRGKDGDLVWATTVPNQKGYGGNTIAFQIDVKLLADNPGWRANDTEYHIPIDIPAEDILFVDRPIDEQYRESDIASLVGRFGADKVKKVLGKHKINDGVSTERISELADVAAEVKIFREQYESLAKEFGYSEQLYERFNAVMTQVQQGAMTSTDAVAKLREEMAAQPHTPKASSNIPPTDDIVAEFKELVKSGDVDDIGDIKAENGALEDRLELLKEISDQYGVDGLSKDAKAYYKLWQKEMDGQEFNDSQQERYDETSESLETAAKNLVSFGETYDKIIVKFGKGKDLEILPNTKGLEDLAQIADEYGVAYNGKEISDVIFVRTQQSAEAAAKANEKLSLTYEQLKDKVEAYYKIKREAVRLFNKGEDISHIAPNLREMEEDIAQYFDKNNANPHETPDGIKMMLQSASFDDKPEDALQRFAQILEIKIPEAQENTIRLAKEQEEAEKRAAELARQRAEEEARIAAEKEKQLAAEEARKARIKRDVDIDALSMMSGDPDLWKDDIQKIVQNYPNLAEELIPERDALKESLKPVDEMASKISSMASIKEIPWDQLGQEAVNAAKRISELYDEGITDSEEYIALQYKILNIFDKKAKSYGGVKGSGAKDVHELRRWMVESIKGETGYDIIMDGHAWDAIFSGAGKTVHDEEGNKRKMRDVAAELINHKNSRGFDGDAWIENDYNRLSSLNKVLRLLESIPPVANDAVQAIDEVTGEQTKLQIEDEKKPKHKFARTINGKHNKFRMKKSEADQGVQTSIDDIVPASAEDSAPKIETEAKAIDEVGKAADKAAGSKKKFVKANKEVAASVTPSVDKLETEADAMEDVGEAAKKVSKTVSKEFNSVAKDAKFSTRDYEKLYDEMESFAAQRRAENGYDLSKVTVNTDAHGNPLGATIAYYKKATKESIVETFKLDKAAQEAEEGVNRLVLSSRKATAGIADFEKATLQAINRQDQLIAQKNKTVSTLSAVLDPNSNRSLAGTDYEEEANRRIQAIKDEVAKLDQVDSAGERIILPEKDFLAIKRRIAELTQDARDFINQSKNAEYAPTQLESHSVSSGNQHRANQLKAQINEWKRAGIYVGDLKTKAEDLAQSVTNITKHEDLKKYLEGMKEARALAKLATQDKKAEEERQKALNKEYEEYIALIAKRDAIESKMIGLDAVKNRDELAALRADYDAVDNELNDKYGNFLSRKDVQERFTIGELASTDDTARRKMAIKEGQISDKKRLEEEAAAQQKINEKYQEYIRLIQERGRKERELVGLDPKKNKEQINTITARIDEIDESLNKTYGDLLSNKIAQATLTLEDFMKYYDKWQQEIAEKEAKAADKARNKAEKPYLDYGKTTANSTKRKRDNLQGEIDALGITNPEVLAKIDVYNAKVQEVVDLRAKFENDPEAAKDPALVKQFQKAAAEAERTRRGIKAVIDEEQRLIQLSAEQGFDPVALSADQISNLESAMIAQAKATAQGRVEIKGWNADHTKMNYTVTNSKGVVEEMTMALGQGRNRMYQYRTATKETGTLIEQVFKGIKVKAKELLSFVIGGGSVYKVIELLRQGIQYVREIDLALTELKKVTDETEESYDKFLETAAKTGARLGSTISAVTEATATFAKLGYTMEQATEMAEAAIVYKNVGDNIASTEDAADSIISTMKGFKLEATESMEIVDRFNEVGNRFAITSQGIGEALRLSASALSEGGNSLDESIGLITAANEVVNDPSSVGTALKTLTLRLRGSKTELEEMGEDVSDMATTTSQLQAKLLALTGGKVDIMLDANTFKNSTQILREMAAAWEDMTDIQRASALELMGGKRQANVLSALIQNFDTVEEVIETSANSAGKQYCLNAQKCVYGIDLNPVNPKAL